LRRVYYLQHSEDVIRVKNRNSQLIIYSEDFIQAERTWHKIGYDFKLNIHAKFNANIMNGIQFCAELLNHGIRTSSVITEFKLYLINTSSWAETFIANVSATQESNGFFTGYIPQSSLGANELSGMETYKVSCTANRIRHSSSSFVYFNHLGCYDSIIRLKHEAEYAESLKLDE